MNSIVSYPERGPYGKNNYRGNTSGYIIKDLIEHYQPNHFVDVTEGGKTSRDVCSELGVKYTGLDIHSGFDVTTKSVLEAIGGIPADMLFSHLPYWNMISYEQERAKHHLSGTGNDLSACRTLEEFLELSQTCLFNQREATRNSGIYTTLIGDMRKNGAFYSFQSDFIRLMPRNELKAVVIKQQNNALSSFRTFRGKFIPINHEYLLIWQRSTSTLAQIVWNKSSELKQNIEGTWRNFVKLAILNCGGKGTLSDIYQQVEQIAPDRVKKNKHYQEKIRQILQMHYEPISKGVWSLN